MPIPVPPVSDTTTLIWDRLFMCRIPNLQTMSEEYIRFFGMPTTGDPGIDKEMSNQLITTMISIAKMVEYSKDGISIRVVKTEDVKTIYEFISLHLQAWKHQISNGINIGNAPIDDLIAMDSFANIVYDKAKFQFTRTMADSIMTRYLSNSSKINKTNFFKEGTDPTEVSLGITRINQDDAVDNFPKRESLTDIFKDRKIGGRKWN